MATLKTCDQKQKVKKLHWLQVLESEQSEHWPLIVGRLFHDADKLNHRLAAYATCLGGMGNVRRHSALHTAPRRLPWPTTADKELRRRAAESNVPLTGN